MLHWQTAGASHLAKNATLHRRYLHSKSFTTNKKHQTQLVSLVSDTAAGWYGTKLE